MVYLIAFIIVILIKFILNFRRYYLCSKYLNHYYDWLKEECKINLLEKQSLVKKLVMDAGYGKGRLAHSQWIGYGQVANYQINPMDAFPNRYQDIASTIISNLSAAKGVYKQRAFEGFSPIFWIELIIFLPRNILSYLGAPKEGITTKLLNVLWWILGTVITTMILNTYSQEISVYIKAIFS